jgi:hypothetical protein
MATATSLYTGLRGVFSVSWFIHRILLKKKNKRIKEWANHLDQEPSFRPEPGHVKTLKEL